MLRGKTRVQRARVWCLGGVLLLWVVMVSEYFVLRSCCGRNRGFIHYSTCCFFFRASWWFLVFLPPITHPFLSLVVLLRSI